MQERRRSARFFSLQQQDIKAHGRLPAFCAHKDALKEAENIATATSAFPDAWRCADLWGCVATKDSRFHLPVDFVSWVTVIQKA